VTYDQAFYDIINDGSRSSAAAVVPMIVDLLHPGKVIDVGCGEGVWTRAFADAGCDVVGLDGAYINQARLCIPPHRFIPHDLTTRLPNIDVADLVVSLEVAEHLPVDRADPFVADLCRLAPVVLFSAAVPGQGGVGHYNEQWPGYWAEKFIGNGYAVSGALRWVFWDDDTVENWYRQNLLLCVSDACPLTPELDVILHGPLAPPWPVIHPVLHDHLRSLR
jgi:SAM-dependent methyltransferase